MRLRARRERASSTLRRAQELTWAAARPNDPPAHTSSSGRNRRQVSSRSTTARAISWPAIAVVLMPCSPNALAIQRPGEISPINGMRCTAKPIVPGPGLLDFDLAQLRVGARDRQLNSFCLTARVTNPGASPRRSTSAGSKSTMR